MISVYNITMADGSVHNMVLEQDYYKFLLATKSLVEEQRKALRSKDKSLIEHSKERERALLALISVYESWRAQYVN